MQQITFYIVGLLCGVIGILFILKKLVLTL